MKLLAIVLRAVLVLGNSGQSQDFLSRSILSHLDELHQTIGCPCGRGIKVDLGPRLSKGARIALTDSPGWDVLTSRAATPRIRPSFIASVEVATEEDVQETVSALFISPGRMGHSSLTVCGR
jgi:hypothetical protein